MIKINDHIIKYKAENSDVMMCRSHELPKSFSSEFILRFTHISWLIEKRRGSVDTPGTHILDEKPLKVHFAKYVTIKFCSITFPGHYTGPHLIFNLQLSRKSLIFEKILKKAKEDVQLTGCPVTRTGQLNLDQLIPAVGVHLRLQFEGLYQKTPRKEKKILATKSLDCRKHSNCEKCPSYTQMNGQAVDKGIENNAHRGRECYDP